MGMMHVLSLVLNGSHRLSPQVVEKGSQVLSRLAIAAQSELVSGSR